VYIHGLAGTGAAGFGSIAPHPLLAGPRSIVLDLPGHGHSDRPADFGYTLDDHAAASPPSWTRSGCKASISSATAWVAISPSSSPADGPSW
jgi:alpha/beta hydrolase family protein